jgi:hypothetical protein
VRRVTAGRRGGGVAVILGRAVRLDRLVDELVRFLGQAEQLDHLALHLALDLVLDLVPDAVLDARLLLSIGVQVSSGLRTCLASPWSLLGR